MTRLIVRAVVIGLVTGVALTQIQRAHQLLAWEIVLIGLALWEMRELPSGEVLEDRPLFGSRTAHLTRLPRAVSSTELTVVDALTGRVTPDRRLQPALRRLASHRLHKRGIDFDSPAAIALLGEAQWQWLATPATDIPDVSLLDGVVSTLEAT